MRIVGRIWIIHEVTGWRKACSVVLLLLLLILCSLSLSLLPSLLLGRENGIWEGRRRCRILGAIREGRSVVVEIQVEPIAIGVAVLHVEALDRDLTRESIECRRFTDSFD